MGLNAAGQETETAEERTRRRAAEDIIRGVGVDPAQHGGIHVDHVMRILAQLQRGTY